MEGTTGLKVTVTASSTAAFTAAVNITGLDIADPRGTIVGLAKADFALSKAGSPLALTSATMVDNGDGTYTFTMTNTAGVFALSLTTPPSAISVVAYNVECVVPGAFTLT